MHSYTLVQRGCRMCYWAVHVPTSNSGVLLPKEEDRDVVGEGVTFSVTSHFIDEDIEVQRS